jgi:hypothetical protein
MDRFRIAIALGVVLSCWRPAFADTVNNPLSSVPIILDGQFTGSINGRIQPGGEWSNVTPLAFIATADQLSATSLGDPRANSFLYAVIAPGDSSNDELYLMYDFLGRTLPFSPGEHVADVAFPITLNSILTPITVSVDAVTVLPTLPSAAVSVDYVFTVKRDSDGAVIAGTGIEGFVGFGPSPESIMNHLLIELEVPLLIPDGFSQILPPGSGVYSPNPAFWNAFAVDDIGDPPISGALFTINPDGSTTASSDALVPESSSLLLAGIGLIALGLLRRKLR